MYGMLIKRRKATNSWQSTRQSTMQNPSLHADQEKNPSDAIPIQI
jgi:hypothetical protein